MDAMNLQKWPMQPPFYSLQYQDPTTYSSLSATDERNPAAKEPESNNGKKMAIPRLPEGSEAGLSSLGRFHRRHVRRACESCRQRKTKCTGDKSGCRNCREAGIICCYTDGKREKSKRQLATLSAKVQTYEEVIRKMSLRFGVSDEQLMCNAMTSDAGDGGLGGQSDTSMFSRGRQLLSGDCTERRSSGSPSARSVGETDHVEEDFNRDENARATGFLGSSSEISWLQKLLREVDGKIAEPTAVGQSSPPLTPGRDVDSAIVSLSYYADSPDMQLPDPVQPHELPSRDVADRLFKAYFSSVHATFPIIGMSTFIAQYQLFFSKPTVKPGNKWLAVLNLIFAIAAVYSHLVRANWESSEDDHVTFFARARALSMKDPLMDHPDLQQLQIEGLTGFYLLATGQINRAWKVSGSAVRGAIALGLHLRNVGSSISDTSKELRYRVWWALYTLDHLLSIMTGRPSCIMDNACTTPVPIPFDERDFGREDASEMLSDTSRKGLWLHDWNPSPPSHMPSPAQGDDSTTESGKTKAESGTTSNWLKNVPTSMSLYFSHLATLSSISKRAIMKLYSAETVHAPWPSLEFTIQSLLSETNAWLANIPDVYDFSTHTQSGGFLSTQKLGLAMLFYSTRVAITRPCLCRLERNCQSDDIYEFCTETAAECVEAATQLLSLLPDSVDPITLYRLSPWWCVLHYLMQATTVLLLELSFRAEHVPEKGVEVSRTVKKAIQWLYELSKFNSSAQRAWRLCDEFLRRLAPQVGIDISDLPGEEPVLDPSSVNFVPSLDTSFLEQQMPTPTIPFMDPDSMDLFDKSLPTSSLRGSAGAFDEYFPYDPATGQLTGSFFPPTTANIDLDLGYVY